MKRRAGGTDLNFDGLTDVVTNLAAGLILLIVLTLNITAPRSAGSGRASAEPDPGVLREPPPSPETESGDKPLDPLLEQVEQLRQTIALLDQAIRDRRAAIDDLRARVEQLRSGGGSGDPSTFIPRRARAVRPVVAHQPNRERSS